MGVGCHFLLQALFLIQGLNLRLLCLPALVGGFFTIEPPGKPWYTHTLEYILLSKNESSIYTCATRLNLENMLSERSQSQKTTQHVILFI